MYGASDIYGAMASEGFGEDSDLAEIDAYLDQDDEDEDDDEEFGAILGIGKGGGILGIAITDKAKQNKMNRLLGKLKKFYEQGKLDKCRRYAKALSKIDPIKKEKEGWITPEVQAWVDYAETGDTDALEEALSALTWAGDEDETPDDEVEGEVYSESGGGRPHRGRRRKLPPGFRPRGYSTWGPIRKQHWLNRHPNAASIRLPIDPGYHGRRGHPGVRAAYRAGRASSSPAPVRHPFMRAAYRAGRASAAPAPAPAPRPVAPGVSRPYGPGRPGMNLAYHAGSRSQPGFPGLRSAFRSGRSSRYGEEADESVSGHPFMRGAHAAGRASTRGQPGHKYVKGSFRAGRAGYGLEEAIEEGVEDAFGALSGHIGADAFRNLQDRDVLEQDILFEDDIDDDSEGDGVDLDDDDDGDESMGAYLPSYGAYVPQFGAIFKKDIEDRLEGARRHYERLVRTTDMTDPDGEKKVMDAKAAYERMARAYSKASDMPEAPRKGRALRRQIAAEEQHPGMENVSLFSAHDEDDDVDEMEEDLLNMGISMGRPQGESA